MTEQLQLNLNAKTPSKEQKAVLCNEIAEIVAYMRDHQIDNRHEGKRHDNSLRKHLHTTSLSEANYWKLLAYREHLRVRMEECTG